jgi:3-deoxy-manno-octulosonate cytidylyltransferase (CMP-KDO synthetase)
VATVGPQSVIEHVCDRVLTLRERLVKSDEAQRGEILVETPCIVTDSQDIAVLVQAKGLEVFMSQASHDSGTARIAEFVRQRFQTDDLDRAMVANIQGDEPFFNVADVARLTLGFARLGASNPHISVATLVHRNHSLRSFLDPSCVKVVRRADGMALYFSRAPVPWPRAFLGTEDRYGKPMVGSVDVPPGWSFWQHLGIYVYQGGYLGGYPKPATDNWDQLDQVEGLEQLAVLHEGKSIWTSEARAPGRGIDTLSDLLEAQENWQALLEQSTTDFER